jgi:hypothetical protein
MRAAWRLAAIALVALVPIGATIGQSFNSPGQFGSGSLRPFVIGVIPVVGNNGSVGGVMIDTEGIVHRADTGQVNQLRQARSNALQESKLSSDINRESPLRKISLRRLQQEILRRAKTSRELPLDMEYLAGMTRVKYIFVYPELNDIVLAGPTETMEVDMNGEYVGNTSGIPILKLCDLLVAWRLDPQQLQQGITCSMDATPDGLQRYARLIRQRNKLNNQKLDRIQQAIGQFELTVKGVPPDSSLARTLVAADVMLKRLGMGLEPTGVPKLASYMQLIAGSPNAGRPVMMPRTWLAPNYEPLLVDEDGLAWQLRSGVKVQCEDGYLTDSGEVKNVKSTGDEGRQWAEQFTRHYRDVAAKFPVFHQLRQCMDWIVIAAILSEYNLVEMAEFDDQVFSRNDIIGTASLQVAKRTEPQVSSVKNRGTLLFGVSGGVEINGLEILSQVETTDHLNATREQAIETVKRTWWWD